MARGKAAEKGKILERQIQALTLRKSGFSYRAIGDRLGVTHVQAYRDVQEELARLTSISHESAVELRAMELERLDMGIKGVMPFIEAGSAPHAQALVKLIAEKAKLLGLYAPEKIQEITWQDEIVELLRSGQVTVEQVRSEVGNELAESLFKRTGLPVVTR